MMNTEPNTQHRPREAPPAGLNVVVERLREEASAIEATIPGSPDRLALKGVAGRFIAARANDNYHVTRARAIAAKIESGMALNEVGAEATRSNFFTSAFFRALHGPSRRVINVRGPSGAGKTTVVRQLMEKRGLAVPIERPGKRRYEGYQVGPGLRVVGDYRRACGGAEGMKDAEIDRVVREYAQHGSVIFEGLFVTNSVARWLQLALDHGNVVFAFLKPPLDVCIKRVVARRAAAGNDQPFNPRRLTETWNRQDFHVRRFTEEAGAQCVWLPWEDPLPTLEAILDGTMRESQAI